MRDELVIPRFLSRARDGIPITIHGDGLQFRNYVYVEDLADAHVLVLAERASNQIFNLEGREPVSIRRVAETVRGLVNPLLAIEFVESRPGDYAGREVSADKAARLLGWEARTSFEDGMRRYADWWLADNEAGTERASGV
jgi:UDP-glucose 4-epimerase